MDKMKSIPDIILVELKAKYGFDRICDVYATHEDIMKDLYTNRTPGYFPEPFACHVYNDWDDLGVTLVEVCDNNMGQWVAAVLQSGLSHDAFDDPVTK